MSERGKPIVKQPSRLATLGPCHDRSPAGARQRGAGRIIFIAEASAVEGAVGSALREERRPMKRSLLVLLALAASAGAALAQDKWPSQPIRIINAFAAGGATDITLRTAAEELRDILGVNVIVENKPGAGGIIAIEDVSRKPADGYTLLGGPSSMSSGSADDEAEAQLQLRRQVHDHLAGGRGPALDDPRPQGARVSRTGNRSSPTPRRTPARSAMRARAR